MTGISIAAKREWNAVLDKFQMNIDSCTKYPFGEYFTTEINGESVVFYRCGVRKVNSSAATQYMIDHFDLKKIIVAGTCAGIDDKFKTLDIFVPNKAVQYDCTVKEQEPLIKDSFTVNFNLDSLGSDMLTGTIGTADKAVVMWKDYLELKENSITIADTESAAIAYICKANNIECVIIKGISDFPTNEQETSNEEQLNSFITNIPIIMNKIVDEYLPLVLKSSVKYNWCKIFIHIKQRITGDLNHRFESPVNLFSRACLSIFLNWFLNKVFSTKFALENRNKKYL